MLKTCPDLEKREFHLGRALFWGEILLVTAFLLFRFFAWFTAPPFVPMAQNVPDKLTFSAKLKRGPFAFFEFPSRKIQTRALILFGSGDFGWGGWEDAVARSLADAGYDVVGIDCAAYAKTDYDLDTLQADEAEMARMASVPHGSHPPPLILGGWSMGAIQAVAAAGGAHPPPHLVGLLLLASPNRGRYGLRVTDKLDIPPTGPGTFGVSDFAEGLRPVRVLQWHGGFDPLDSVSWLQTLPAPHQELVYEHGFHDFNGPSPDFFPMLVDSVNWILQP